jgi:chromosome partitioning protein
MLRLIDSFEDFSESVGTLGRIMLGIHGSSDLRRIVVLNPKGGAGKTTLAFNLAGYLAATKRKVALIDMDQQGSSSHWLARRPAELPPIHGISASSAQSGAHVNLNELAEFTVGSHAIIVPVMPSELDIHAASRLIADLLLVARVSRENGRLGVIANRVKERTIAYRQLMKFLERLSIPVIGVIRDSQNYVSAAREGLCIHELPASKAAKDLKRWESVIEWLDQRLETPLDERDLRRPDSGAEADEPTRGLRWKPATAAALVLIAASALVWNIARAPDADVSVSPTAAGTNFEEPEPLRTADSVGQKPALSGVVQSGRNHVTAVDPAARDDAGDGPLPPASDEVATVAGKPPERAAAEVESEAPEPARTPDTLREKWQLSGVVQSGGGHVVLLTRTSDASTRTVTAGIDVDGWLVKDAGRDFAVLAKDGEEVRLKLSRQDPDSQSTESP